MEIRQIKKEIDIRPASYLDENAGYVENRESKKIPLKFRSSLVQINSHVSWVNSGLADKKSNGNTANKERNRYTTGVIFRRECRKCREILFKFKVHQDLLFIHIRTSDMTSFLSSDLFRITF